ncbi:MAG: Calx-beta domain-containing protein [Pyrinomonadaceae bacterium]
MRRTHNLKHHVRRLLGLAFALMLVASCCILVGYSSSSASQTPAGSDSGRAAKPPVFADFEAWANRHVAAGVRQSSEQMGLELAAKRRDEISKLIVSDPATALRLALPASIKQGLPAEIKKYVEEEISGYGDFQVLVSDGIDAATGALTHSSTERFVVMNGVTYRASVYGRRLSMTSKNNIPLHGIVIDGVMAVDESPVQRLESGEIQANAVQPNGSIKPQIKVDVGGKILRFDDQQLLEKFTKELVRREALIGPNSANVEKVKSSVERRSDDDERLSLTADSAWTEGPKTLLYMRVDFSDMPGEPISSSQAQSIIDTDVNNFFRDNSYGKTSLKATVTPLLRMPQTNAYYDAAVADGTYSSKIKNDARAAAKAAGFDTANFNLDIVALNGLPSRPVAGEASLGGKGILLYSVYDFQYAAHELGHNYGLNHANSWRTSDGSVIGNGISKEYGDRFDMMGLGHLAHNRSFNVWFKFLLNWLTPSDIQTVAGSGTYRIQPHDSANATGIRALRILGVSNNADYWVEFRQAIDLPSLLSGSIIHWGHSRFRNSNILDMTPGSNVDEIDVALPAGQTFTDSNAGISITQIPGSFDVQVKLTKFVINGQALYSGGFSGMSNTTITLSGTRSGTTLTDENGLYAFAVEPNGNYTLVASNGDRVFAPASRSISNLTGSQKINFVEAASSIRFGLPTSTTSESAGRADIVVIRDGDNSGTATINYTTVDNPAAIRCDDLTTMPGVAFARCDYATTVDTLRFAPGENFKVIQVPLIDDAYVEGDETIQLRLSNAIGAELGVQSTATKTITDNDTAGTPNPIFSSGFFVRMQYLDFLSREPETDGLAAWLRVLNNCSNVNSNPACDRITVSSSFFRSQEFQLKGYFVYLFYKAALNRRPLYDEIIADMRGVTGQTPEEVYAKKAAFTNALAARQEFRNAYDGLTNTAYVDALLGRYSLASITTPDPASPDGTTFVTLTKNDLVSRLNAQTLTRAQALRALVQSREVDAAEYNGAFVAMQYYGYLRRAPDEDGYQAWLRVINANPTDARIMVNGFMNSVEYRLRFGAP